MATACITHGALKVHGISKPIIARFDQPQASSDGGAILIKAVDDRLGLTWRFASVTRDHRPPSKITDPPPGRLPRTTVGRGGGCPYRKDPARRGERTPHRLLPPRRTVGGARP